MDKPYYNEPGHERHADTVEGEQQARLYNENARLLSLQATTAACARRRADLQLGVVAAHFARVGPFERRRPRRRRLARYRRVLRQLAPRAAADA